MLGYVEAAEWLLCKPDLDVYVEETRAMRTFNICGTPLMVECLAVLRLLRSTRLLLRQPESSPG